MDRNVVVNNIFLSLLFFFILMWERIKKVQEKIKTSLETYFDFGTIERSKVRNRWLQYCQIKSKGGIKLIHINDAQLSL